MTLNQVVFQKCLVYLIVWRELPTGPTGRTVGGKGVPPPVFQVISWNPYQRNLIARPLPGVLPQKRRSWRSHEFTIFKRRDVTNQVLVFNVSLLDGFEEIIPWQKQSYIIWKNSPNMTWKFRNFVVGEILFHPDMYFNICVHPYWLSFSQAEQELSGWEGVSWLRLSSRWCELQAMQRQRWLVTPGNSKSAGDGFIPFFDIEREWPWFLDDTIWGTCVCVYIYNTYIFALQVLLQPSVTLKSCVLQCFCLVLLGKWP